MNVEHMFELCQSGQAISLATWLGEPLSRPEAISCIASIQGLLCGSRDGGVAYFNRRLAQMIARYWAGQYADMDYRSLAATLELRRDKARLELCYGQLLLARRLDTAWRHLDAGFAAAANLLQPEEYFVVLKRHERLRLLVLSPCAGDAAGLEELLQEADVIRRLQGRNALLRIPSSQHLDTLD